MNKRDNQCPPAVCAFRNDSSVSPLLEEHGNDMALQPCQRMVQHWCSESSSHPRQEHLVTRQKSSAFAHVAVSKEVHAATRPIDTQPKLTGIYPRHSRSNAPRLLGYTDERVGKSLIIVYSLDHRPPLFYCSRPKIQPSFAEAKTFQIRVRAREPRSPARLRQGRRVH